MKTKSFVSKLNLITKALFSMTPAQREVVHQSIQALDTEISTDDIPVHQLIIYMKLTISH